MRRSTLLMCALLTIATSGCKQINEQWAKVKAKIAAARQPTRPARQAPAVPLPARDVPYDSPDTGTIAPDMSEREVYSLWGPPIAVRRQGDMTYLYYRNGCEYTCGTEDVVFLQNGKVVDAVLRWPGHGYSGQSSSPFATPPHLRRGGDTLTVKPPSSP